MRIYHAIFNGLSKYATVGACVQYDYNPTLRIQGLTLPNAVEVHFSLQDSGGTSVTRIGVTKDGVTDVPIPDFVVDGNDSVKDYKAYVFIYLRDNESAWTEYRITMMFDSRPKPEGHTRPDQSSMSELLKQVNTIADDKITKPTVGKVGQAVVIKTVGADGKPIDFEARDSGGAVSPQEIESAVGSYLTKNPITETDPTVPQWAKEPTKPTYTAQEVGALADTTVIPSKLSEMAEDTTHRTVTDVEKQKWNGKAEKSDIPDVATIVAEHDTSPTAHNDIREDLTRVKQNLKEFVKTDQGVQNANKVLEVGVDGNVVPTDKPTIPTQLPNPQKLTFQGAVTAEYDGSGAVTVTIPSASGNADVERIEKLATDTNVELEPNKLYIFPEMASLTYTLKAPSKANVANEYHFVFKSGASATQLVHALGVNVGTFKVEPNKIYEISIMENLLTSQSWAVV